MATGASGTYSPVSTFSYTYTGTGAGNDNGQHTFYVTLDTAGSQTVGVSDPAADASAAGSVTVIPAATAAAS